jgi:hypothetical protein
VRSDPRDVVAAIEISRATYKKMIQNLVWATAITWSPFQSREVFLSAGRLISL